MKLVVTGALGHIGSALIRDSQLLASCKELVLIDDLSTQRYASLFNLPSRSKYTFLEGDVGDQLTTALAEGADAIVHLAGKTEPSASVANPDTLFGNNLRITRHIADTCALTGTPLVFVSTTSVYTSRQPIVDESSTDLTPVSPYARCKLEEESYLSQVLGDTSWVIFRLGTIFGVSPGMRFHTAVNRFCWHAATGKPIEVWSTAMDQLRPYLSISDASATIRKAVVEEIYPREIVNAVSCDSTVRDVLNEISSFGCKINVDLVDNVMMNSFSFRTSTEKAFELGLEFNGDLREGVFETLALLRGLTGPSV